MTKFISKMRKHFNMEKINLFEKNKFKIKKINLFPVFLEIIIFFPILKGFLIFVIFYLFYIRS